MDALAIFDKIKQETKREDKPFQLVEFNLRDNIYIMNVIYGNVVTTRNNHHTFPHDLDPEILNKETYEQLTELLDDKKIPYTVRNDDFI